MGHPIIDVGLLVYVNPLSAPVWAMCILLGYIFFFQKDWGWRKRILHLFFIWDRFTCNLPNGSSLFLRS